MKLSRFGERFTGSSGIVDLMDDLGRAMSLADKNTCMLGGGNPAQIPEVNAVLREQLRIIADDTEASERMLGIYAPPEGHPLFRKALAEELRAEMGWDVTEENIFISNGSQSGFFLLFNLLASPEHPIVLPMTPEYIGYADQGCDGPLFVSSKPSLELHGEQRFKYKVDFDALDIPASAAAICCSRPTNPTGNVMTDDEVQTLSALAKAAGIPLIFDHAYGMPFPNIVFRPAQPHWDDNTILCMSLSKFGLPAARTGIMIASQSMVRALGRANTILGLSSGSVGPEIGYQLLKRGQLMRLSQEVIQPYYQKKCERAVEQLSVGLKGLPCRLHEPEGALFLWLWCQNCPITSQALYERLKSKGVLVIPGESFFPGCDEAWSHRQECLRLSYAQDEAQVEKGLSILIQELQELYANKG